MLQRCDLTEIEVRDSTAAAKGVEEVSTVGLNDDLAARGRGKSKTSCETLGPIYYHLITLLVFGLLQETQEHLHTPSNHFNNYQPNFTPRFSTNKILAFTTKVFQISSFYSCSSGLFLSMDRLLSARC